MTRGWDLTALVNAADPRAAQAERNLWLVRLLEWLRHAPTAATARAVSAATAAASTTATTIGPEPALAAALAHGQPEPRTPLPVLRLRHLLNLLDAHPAVRERVAGLWAAFWQDVDAPALLADFGFPARQSLSSALLERLQQRWLPGTPETRDLAALFRLLARPQDARWLAALDEATLERLATLLAGPGWRERVLEAITIVASAVHAAGYAPALRQRMDPTALAGEPFGQLAMAAAELRGAVLEARAADALREANHVRALLDRCRRAAESVGAHLEAYGVSADIVFAVDQLVARTVRIELLLDCVLAPDRTAAAREWRRLIALLAEALAGERGIQPLLAQNYSLLARQVAERNAETGEHYITRTRAEYRDMLRRAAGGGLVIAGTTFGKFAIAALGLAAFWNGFFSGAWYAASFTLVMLLHWTVATKQPAMTAPALAAGLAAGLAAAGSSGGSSRSDAGLGGAGMADAHVADADVADAVESAIEDFVDRVAQIIRSQAAGVFGNVAACVPLVLAAQWAALAAFGAPMIGPEKAAQVLGSLTLLGPTALFAAFTGVLLFASSLIAGWTENWFVFHRLDSALAWNPRIVGVLGAPRAQRWAAWWRRNVSGLAASVSLGMLLGLVPALAGFFGLPLDVRHVTLASGQLAAASAALGLSVLTEPAFWWCVAGIAFTGVLNVGVSFWLAFKVALRSRGVRVRERSRIAAAIRRRVLRRPGSFVLPPRD